MPSIFDDFRSPFSWLWPLVNFLFSVRCYAKKRMFSFGEKYFEKFCGTNFCGWLILQKLCGTNFCEFAQNQQKAVPQKLISHELITQPLNLLGYSDIPEWFFTFRFVKLLRTFCIKANHGNRYNYIKSVSNILPFTIFQWINLLVLWVSISHFVYI